MSAVRHVRAVPDVGHGLEDLFAALVALSSCASAWSKTMAVTTQSRTELSWRSTPSHGVNLHSRPSDNYETFVDPMLMQLNLLGSLDRLPHILARDPNHRWLVNNVPRTLRSVQHPLSPKLQSAR